MVTKNEAISITSMLTRKQMEICCLFIHIEKNGKKILALQKISRYKPRALNKILGNGCRAPLPKKNMNPSSPLLLINLY